MHKSSIYLRDELKQSFGDLATRTGRSEADLIRHAIELFLHLDGDLVTARPMKGTARRAARADEDERVGQGPGRERDDRRSDAQRSLPSGRTPWSERPGTLRRRTLRDRLAADVDRAGRNPVIGQHRRCSPSNVSVWFGDRSTEGHSDAFHRPDRAVAAWRVLRCDRRHRIEWCVGPAGA